MKKLLLLTFVVIAGALLQPTRQASAQRARRSSGGSGGDAAFKKVHDEYVVEFLRRNPTVNTYLGGAGLDASLAEADGRLRDHSADALRAEDLWLARMERAFMRLAPRTLSPARRIDREVALAQIRFLLRQHRVRRYQERAVDTYTDEPFRAVDWQLQGMTQTGAASYGTPEEWTLLANRLDDVERFLQTAQAQLRAGVRSGNTPDHRMIRRHGINSAEANAEYFEKTLPALAAERIAAGDRREALLSRVRVSAARASAAYRRFASFIRETFFEDATRQDVTAFKPQFRSDRYALGAAEYDWAIRNNLRLTKTSAQLYEEAWPVVRATRNEMIELAHRIGAQRGMRLPAGEQAVRLVFDELSKDYPKSDAEMVAWYREASFRLVDYGRRTGLFDVPADYKLEVVETPPPLRAAIDGAAYYPAPPFKQSGVGRFYVTPTDNNEEALKTNNRASLADLAAHEGFPGHDWHFKVMTEFKNDIAPVRWLTPGAVEDSSSMWEDSMASEGWALYAEALMTEPQPGAPEGFYTPEERLYQLQGKLYRDLRVRVDTGLHTGRLSYEDAVTLFSEIVDFQPGRCNAARGAMSAAKRASCESSERAIFRYSKWPTQAITYRLGREQIYELRREAARLTGARFSPKEFHLLFMKQGTIPSGYFHDQLLLELRRKR
ncbi:MAG TPA: DUF885 domain-containing protein [Pyrinomonadaceae bacterium]|nr:DUF885 domain-containing protein [Pyrinomonadaceae bacterium]